MRRAPANAGSRCGGRGWRTRWHRSTASSETCSRRDGLGPLVGLYAGAPHSGSFVATGTIDASGARRARVSVRAGRSACAGRLARSPWAARLAGAASATALTATAVTAATVAAAVAVVLLVRCALVSLQAGIVAAVLGRDRLPRQALDVAQVGALLRVDSEMAMPSAPARAVRPMRCT